MPHVFISYKREDRPFVDELEKHIEQAGLKVWTDRKIPAGENWEAAIDKAIQECFVLLFVVTPKARLSEYVTYEWSYAIGHGITVIPLLVEPSDIHPRLNKIQLCNFMITPAPWDELLERLKILGSDPQISIKEGFKYYITEAHKQADLKVIKQLWQFINSKNIHSVVKGYEFRSLIYQEFRENVMHYL